ncbi:uncharacterized protein LOC113331805 isoform X1 [Papaver somniferum]|uniref:uncharacterized protein LOC113331805 isoform X1 n=1 Tax=Papaver somniferum TaxID=3469 RepID=UPI000E6FB878|nr:uncharacterized protein LOC113331805 isoform X1 [Papaver somniferum]XP_026434230.1 uncharacterized protein LOC113331805 isoform X1 [Papaver somniferum]XP_026434231.1 uncharacterized protein LOC113331805 isoform X1 [Papaver somniferum]
MLTSTSNKLPLTNYSLNSITTSYFLWLTSKTCIDCVEDLKNQLLEFVNNLKPYPLFLCRVCLSKTMLGIIGNGSLANSHIRQVPKLNPLNKLPGLLNKDLAMIERRTALELYRSAQADIELAKKQMDSVKEDTEKMGGAKVVQWTLLVKPYDNLVWFNLWVAKIVAHCMRNYLLFEHLLQVHIVPTEKVHPKL